MKPHNSNITSFFRQQIVAVLKFNAQNNPKYNSLKILLSSCINK